MKDSTFLLYDKPACAWTQALPIGNGTLGGMIYGKVKEETVSLNHDELWTGHPKDTVPDGALEAFQKARALALDGKLRESQDVIESDFMSTWSQAYLPLGDLILTFDGSERKSGYVRSLDLETAIASVSYRQGKRIMRREMFASYPEKMIVIRLTCENGCFDVTAKLDCKLRHKMKSQEGLLVLSGEAPSEHNTNGLSDKQSYSKSDSERGMLFSCAVKADTDGKKHVSGKGIEITGATAVTLCLTAETSFNGWQNNAFTNGKPHLEPCLERLKKDFDYEAVKAAHIADYRALYSRVELDIGSNGKEDVPTGKRLRDFKTDKNDIALYTLLFNYGRYLAIASSRPGSQPSTLQGIWNEKLCPPWHSNYTVNINTEMNYWPVLPCDMLEVNEPLIEMVRDLSVAGERTAKEMYGMSGFVAHHNVDIWRLTTPVAGNAVWAFWPMSPGWFCEHIFAHYEYTLDEKYLRETAYPIMKKAAEFYCDYLVEDRDGYLIAAPSTSPENNFLINGRQCAVSQTTTMTMSIIRELFENCVKASEILGEDGEFAKALKDKLGRLLPFKIGKKGQLLEWYNEEREAEIHHRHCSMLYGLHPAHLITAQGTPELADACRRSLEIRGDDGTGWSLGWKINFWARLRDGNHALRLFDRQLRFKSSTGMNYSHGGGTYENLFDAHPPFQIDGNFGAVSGVCEMLLDCFDCRIFLLPALPDKWSEGSVRGLLAKGNIKVDMTWSKGKLTSYSLTGKGEAHIVYGGQETVHRLDGGTLTVKL